MKRAAGSLGVILVLLSFTEGGASAHVVERLVDCYMSDDNETRVYQGTMPAGGVIDLVWDWCAPEDVVMEPGFAWEGSFEALSIDVSGRGEFLVEIAEIYDGAAALEVHPMPPPKNGYEAWHRCATYHNRVNVTGTAFGETTFRLTNIGDKLARDVEIVSHVGTSDSGFRAAHCPIESDWGL